ncbi:hypothetical protein F4694_004062 [Bacillus niacini]|uniref:Rhamnogalacturonase A/B/Epimerase-like pectate lyase domain-containing protein n=1 Tax=Neobacillus niacini TaxID=86668 RepID=A0A852TI72_9BACI|nr:glycosyl hydrolase family 28-related protein [Neobacillus niacini]NYE07277.1 hypothetical protein [Neobacillus niacini]
MGKYGTLGSAFDRIFRNTLNKALDDVDTDIQAQKKRVDDLIVGTPQPSEVVDSRGGFPVLGDRLNDLTSNLAQSAKQLNNIAIDLMQDYGADFTGVSDHGSLLQQAIDFVASNGGGVVYLPKGTLKSTVNILVKSNVEVKGNGKSKTIIQFIGCSGFVSPTDTYINNFKLRDMTIKGDAGLITNTNSGYHAIGINSGTKETMNCVFENIFVREFRGKGVYIPNMFSCRFTDIQVDFVADNGIEIEGGNTTLLENCYVHSVATGKAAYVVYSSATLINCNGVDNADIWGVFGQDVATDGKNSIFNITLLNCNIEDFKKIGLRFKFNGSFKLINTTFLAPSTGTFEYYTRVDYSDKVSMVLDSNFQSKGATILTLAPHYLGGGNPFLFFANGESTVTDGTNVWSLPSIGTQRSSSYLKNAVKLSRAYIDDIDYMKLGGKRHHFGTAAPTTGTWAVGDIYYNTAPVAGGKVGWICTTAGTPGTWKSFGAIDA